MMYGKQILHKPASTLAKPSSCQIGLTQGHSVTEKEFHNICTESIKKKVYQNKIYVLPVMKGITI